ncbi:MAG: DUF4968 domain-containing protein, partial [Lachnospiraceae bacterium]|nr:DUF4968 domain-containing protein [Lachnospiraceae bacterium]
MLQCIPNKRRNVVKAWREKDALCLKLENGLQRIVPVNSGIVRVLFTEKESFSDQEKPGIIELPTFGDWSYQVTGEAVVLEMKHLKVEIDLETNRYQYFDGEGRLLLSERAQRSKELAEFPVYRMDETKLEKTYVDTPDGRKEVIKEPGRIQTGTAYHTRLNLEFSDEALYGLGQHEEGYGSLRGKRVYLHQANRKIAIPMLVSTKGYGIMINTYAPAIFNDTEEGTYLYTEADPEMDFFFISGHGENAMDQVISGYRIITGKAALLPKWAFGYVQSQERYETQEEILEVAQEYRERGIGLDCIVLDWCSWPEGQWGQKTFDETRFPNPSEMIEKLHEDHVHFMLSIWPNLTEGTENYEEFKEKNLLLPGINNYDPLKAEGRETYWSQVERGLFCHGVDAWWCDNSEPFTPEWNYLVKPESAKTYEEYCRTTSLHLPATQTNAYGFYHAQAIYEGQRASTQEKRVINLTRSGYLGQQRFGTILWSGDISASWDTLRRQIAAGIHFCAIGLPYWTVDIGAFFVKNGLQWFWNGDYDLGTGDPAYCELFTRWYQWGAFLPIFRGHGTDFRRELWEFDRPEALFYDALLKANRMRYELMPYIYSLAGMTYVKNASIIKPLAFAFPKDHETWEILDQYLFGDEMMICPVTESYYFTKPGVSAGKYSDMEGTAYRRRVYLPAGTGWYDYHTNEYYEGGQWITVDAPLDQIPVFVKAGAILPKKEFA